MSRNCPRCHTPLIFYGQSGYSARWAVDDHERRTRERRDRYGA